MFVARLLKDKGVVEFCEMAKKLGYIESVSFVLVGDLDSENPNSLTISELNEYVKIGAVEHWGFSLNVEELIPLSHIVVLPSYREGLSKSLLEAAACGRAVVTTDVPGCRDAIEKNTGVLVPAKSVGLLVSAVESLLVDDKKRVQMGLRGRILAENCFDIKDVVDKHMKLYKEIL
jgi:glycosyltransferase involved in cell wall biosynthesis